MYYKTSTIIQGNFPDWHCSDIADAIISRMEDTYQSEEDLFDAVYQAMDDELIYTNDQWQILMGYSTPQEANWNNAINEFTEDLCVYVNELYINDEEDED